MAEEMNNTQNSATRRFRTGFVSLGSSKRSLPLNAPIVGTPDPSDPISISLHLRRASVDASGGNSSGAAMPGPADRATYEQQFGASEADIKLVEDFAAEYGLTVDEASSKRRVVKVSGTLDQLAKAFNPTLQLAEIDGRQYRVRDGELSIPAELAHVVVAVLGFDNRPAAQPHFRLRRHKKPTGTANTPPAMPPGSLEPSTVAALYSFPAPANASANPQCIGIIELGGGYDSSDLSAYFTAVGVNAPEIVAVSVGGGSNTPTGDPNSADGEVCLDIEVAGSVAPNAKLAVYFATNTDQDFADAITTAVHDSTNKPTVLSISWGGPESSYTSQAITVFEQALEDAVALGIPVFVAAGDNGSSDVAGDPTGTPQVDYPASSPNAIGCGGTKLEQPGGSWQETVWNDLSVGEGATGGGVSSLFDKPAFQSAVTTINMRGVPDVSGDADPETGYFTYTDGQSSIVGGTSAVAPLWAALTAILFQNLGKPVMNLAQVLYTRITPSAFHDITQGSNGAFNAAVGWDPCSGLGTPIGNELLSQLQTIETSDATQPTASAADSRRAITGGPAAKPTI